MSHVAGTPESFLTAATDLPLRVLVRQVQEELDRVRVHAEGVADEFRRRVQMSELVEIVEGHEAVLLWYEQLQRSANGEILQLGGPLYDGSATEVERLRDGVRYRTIYDAAALRHPRDMAWIESVTRAGEDARAVSSLPVKALIADHGVAVLPMTVEVRETAAALLVFAPVLIEVLRTVFETTWERGVPITAPNGESDSRQAPFVPSSDDCRILALAAAGLKDVAIAYEMELSLRTVRRRIARLMRALGAENRFQVGYQVARLGWLERAESPDVVGYGPHPQQVALRAANGPFVFTRKSAP